MKSKITNWIRREIKELRKDGFYRFNTIAEWWLVIRFLSKFPFVKVRLERNERYFEEVFYGEKRTKGKMVILGKTV